MTIKRLTSIISPVAALLGQFVAAETQEVDLNFIIQPGSRTEMGIYVGGNPSNAATTFQTYSGNLAGTLAFDTESFEFLDFEFTGGQMFGSAYQLIFLSTDLASPRVSTIQKIQQPANNPPIPPTRYIPRTTFPLFRIGPDGILGEFSHELRVDQGFVITAVTIPAFRETFNFTLTPQSRPLPGLAAISFDLLSETRISRRLRATLTVGINNFETTALPQNSGFLVTTEEGAIVAESSPFNSLTSYGRWAADNRLADPDPEDSNQAGIPYGILFALDRPADTSALPITIENTASGPNVTITLPESGLRNPMSVEYSFDLSAGDWPDLPDFYYVDGTDSLDQNATGQARFSFPFGTEGFIRFVTIVD